MNEQISACRDELLRRRRAIEVFVAERHDYLATPYSKLPLKDRPYFGAQASRFTASFDGKDYTYNLPDLGSIGTHNSKCRDEETFGRQVVSTNPSDCVRRLPSLSKLAKAQVSGNKVLKNKLRIHRNFWVEELFRASDSQNADEIGYKRVMEYLEAGLLKKVIQAYEEDSKDFDNPVQKQFLIDAACSTFMDCLNVFRVDCSHFVERTCLFCGIVFLPDAITYAWMGAGPHFCAFCAQSATDCQSDLYFRDMSKSQIVDLLEFGLQNQNAEPQEVLNQIRSRNPNNEPELHLATLGMAEMSPEDALAALSQIAVRPRSVMTELIDSNIEEWVFLHSDNPKRGAIGSDGHFCQSKGELAICEYLTRVGLSHTMHPKYTDIMPDKEVALGKFRGDLRIENSIVEFAGFDSEEYAQRLALKIQMSNAIGLDLIVVRDSDLKHLDVIFEKFLNAQGQNPFLF